MLILKEIRLVNFLSHEDTNLVFHDGDKVLLDGISGSGKSSIVDALIWALYGVGRVDNRSLIRKGAKDGAVSVTFLDGKTSYTVVRSASISGKNNVTVLKDTSEIGTGGIRDTDEYIVNLLGASHQLFINSVVFPQDNSESFVGATSVRRKELLLEILKTGDIDEYLSKTKSLLAEKSAELSVDIGSLHTSEALVAAYGEKVKDLPTYFVRENIINGEIEAAKDALKVAEKEESKVQNAYDKVAEDEKRIEELQTKVFYRKEKIEHPKEYYEAVVADEESARAELSSAITHNGFISSITADRPVMRDYEGEIGAIDRRITKIVDETLECPAGDACPYSKLIGPELANLKEERKKKEESLAQQEIGLKSWEGSLASAGDRIDTEPLESKLRHIGMAHVALKQIKGIEEEELVKKEIEKIRKSIGDAPSMNDVLKATKKAGAAADILRVLERELSEIVGSIQYLNTLNEEVGSRTKEIKTIKKAITKLEEETKLLGELREALGTTGVTAVALDYLLPSLEDKINEILSMLSDFRVTLSTQKEGVKGNIEGLFITVTNPEGQEMDFNSYSGGERVRISVAIGEALASLQKCGFRVMDEAIVSLDENMTESFTSVLAKIQSRYSQLICVSHLSAVKDLFEKRIAVTKLDGISTVVVV